MLINGGMVGIAQEKASAPAIVEAFYPGFWGATAIAETLFGLNDNLGGEWLLLLLLKPASSPLLQCLLLLLSAAVCCRLLPPSAAVRCCCLLMSANVCRCLLLSAAAAAATAAAVRLLPATDAPVPRRPVVSCQMNATNQASCRSPSTRSTTPSK